MGFARHRIRNDKLLASGNRTRLPLGRINVLPVVVGSCRFSEFASRNASESRVPLSAVGAPAAPRYALVSFVTVIPLP